LPTAGSAGIGDGGRLRLPRLPARIARACRSAV